MSKVELSLEEYEALKKEKQEALEKADRAEKKFIEQKEILRKILTPFPIDSNIIDKINEGVIKLEISQNYDKNNISIRIYYEVDNYE